MNATDQIASCSQGLTLDSPALELLLQAAQTSVYIVANEVYPPLLARLAELSTSLNLKVLTATRPEDLPQHLELAMMHPMPNALPYLLIDDRLLIRGPLVGRTEKAQQETQCYPPYLFGAKDFSRGYPSIFAYALSKARVQQLSLPFFALEIDK